MNVLSSFRRDFTTFSTEFPTILKFSTILSTSTVSVVSKALTILLSLTLLAVSGCVLIACKPRNTQQTLPSGLDKGKVTVGTFNIAWLGDGTEEDKEHRSEDDYKHIADVIRDANPDVLGVEEIENGAAVERIFKYLPGYKYIVGKEGGQQNVGFIIREEVAVELVEEYMPIVIERGRNRPGLVVRCKAGNFDWIMMVVHFKSSSRYDSTQQLKEHAREIRKQQSEKVAEWVKKTLATSKEQDLIIVGDFNDYPTNDKYPMLAPLTAIADIRFVTYNAPSCKKATWKSIDHIIASTSAQKRLVNGSVTTISFHQQFPDAVANKISDHCPVVCQFNSTLPDND